MHDTKTTPPPRRPPSLPGPRALALTLALAVTTALASDLELQPPVYEHASLVAMDLLPRQVAGLNLQVRLSCTFTWCGVGDLMHGANCVAYVR